MTLSIVRCACAWAGLSAVLGACSVLPEKAPVTVYQMPSYLNTLPRTAPEANLTPANARATIRVATPSASPTLGGDRILVSQSPYQIMAYKGVRWHDQAPRLVRNRLVQAFKSSGHWQAVTTDNSTARVAYQLVTELIEFQVLERDGTRKVNVRMDATLIDASRNQVVAAQPFYIESRVNRDDFGAVVEAFGKATDQLGTEVSSWLLNFAKP